MGKSATAKTAAPRKRAAADVFCLKVTLRHTKPPVWRRILVPGDMTLGDLHVAIQTVMGWDDAHLHTFDVGGQQFGDPSMVDDVVSEKRLTLKGVAESGVTRFTYNYDFGDDWEHTIVIEKTTPAHTTKALPACIGGKRSCPPEDCGGPWGYDELLSVLADPAHPEYQERREWLGEEFDPDDFSVPYADTLLAATFRRNDPPAKSADA